MASELTWFQLWATKHARAFGLTDAELQGLFSWEPALSKCYSERELHAATEAMMAAPDRLLRLVGKTLERHLEALRSAVHEGRAVNIVGQRDPEAHWGICSLCGGSGRVSVPNLDGVKDGEWRPMAKARRGPAYYTYCVTCRCALGKWYDLNNKRGGMTLDQYESLNPRWQQQVWKHQEELKAELEARARAEGAAFGVLDTIANLTERFRGRLNGTVSNGVG